MNIDVCDLNLQTQINMANL